MLAKAETTQRVKIGFYADEKRPDVQVFTYKEAAGAFETVVKHPKFGSDVVLANTYTSKISANEGHVLWVHWAQQNEIPPKHLLPFKETHLRTVDKKKNVPAKSGIYITLAAIVNLFVKGTDKDNRLLISSLKNESSTLMISIMNGKYRGALMYDTTKKKAWSISPLWEAIIEQAKIICLDSQQAVYDEENANMWSEI